MLVVLAVEIYHKQLCRLNSRRLKTHVLPIIKFTVESVVMDDKITTTATRWAANASSGTVHSHDGRVVLLWGGVVSSVYEVEDLRTGQNSWWCVDVTSVDVNSCRCECPCVPGGDSRGLRGYRVFRGLLRIVMNNISTT